MVQQVFTRQKDSWLRYRKVFASALVGLALLGGDYRLAGEDQQPREPTKVEFELLRSLHIAVNVKINDAGPRRLIFDLGAPVNLVSARFAAEAGLITQKEADRPAFFGMRGDKTAARFQVGDLKALDVPVMVMDHPTIKAISEVLGPIDGIVGYPFFARYRFTIDYPAKTMSFVPGEYKPVNVMSQMMNRMMGGRNSQPARITPAALFGIEVEKTGDAGGGVTVVRVWPSSPAAAAGLQPNDRLLSLDGRWTDSVPDALDAASRVRLGDPVTTKVLRADKTLDLVVIPIAGI